ncbi:putative 2-oxoglutarate-dependent dioxygenase DIN11 [Yarrowia sp. E02]|nr:putative 2-oxoglutarate-dependent dioxygenase DIN11 [Yarrowia sp. E02]
MFTSIPIIDLSEDTPSILSKLRPALLNVGFCYIKNYGVDPELVAQVTSLGKQFFELPQTEKNRIDMSNSPHFLGYSRLGDEITKNQTDWREQMDLATELPAPEDSEPLYRRLRGPNQWPDEELLPGFRTAFETYIEQMGPVSIHFVSLIAQALGLEADAFAHLFEQRQQHKLKVVRYPDVSEVEGEVEPKVKQESEVPKVKQEPEEPSIKQEDVEVEIQEVKEQDVQEVKHEVKHEASNEQETSSVKQDVSDVKQEPSSVKNDPDASQSAAKYSQGVGPHKDSELTSYLLQCTPHRGLQVLNSNGEWIDVPPIEGTLVVAMGQAMEALTRGYCVSTTHRVLAPEAGSGSRFSIPFFQGISYDANFREFKLPPEVEESLKKNQTVTEDTGQYRHDMFSNIGEATFMNRIRSHPTVAKRWYKDVVDVSKLDTLPGVLSRLGRIFSGAEKTMMFHNSPLPLSFDHFAKSVLEYSHEKVSHDDLSQLFALWPNLYRTEVRRDGMLMLSLDNITSVALTQTRDARQKQFDDLCWKWLRQHPVSWAKGPEIDQKKKAAFSKKRGVSETAESLRKTPVTKQRIFKLATPDTKLGGSVLERIKARKAASAHLNRKSEQEEKSEAQQRFLDSNIPRVVDVLVGAGKGNTATIPMDKAIRMVNDSVRRNLSEKEARAILVRVSQAVPSFCKLVEVGDQAVLKLSKKTRGEVQHELKLFEASEAGEP